MNSKHKPTPLTADERAWINAKEAIEITGKIIDALKPLSASARRRILNYVLDYARDTTD